MGGMGRIFDGGYAEYTCVSVRQVVPFQSALEWATLGAVPEMLQTSPRPDQVIATRKEPP
jgi:NADPH:quinone reductase